MCLRKRGWKYKIQINSEGEEEELMITPLSPHSPLDP
jgi:hypothetical protein